jgi:hypothetical protein
VVIIILSYGIGSSATYIRSYWRDLIIQVLCVSFTGIPWTSGTLVDTTAIDKEQKAEANRLEALKKDPTLPLVYLDVAIKGRHIGRILIVLFTKESPRAAENFRALCTGRFVPTPSQLLTLQENVPEPSCIPAAQHQHELTTHLLFMYGCAGEKGTVPEGREGAGKKYHFKVRCWC